MNPHKQSLHGYLIAYPLFTVLVTQIFFPEILHAENSRQMNLDQALTNSQLAKSPDQQKTENKSTKSSGSVTKTTKKSSSTSSSSVQANSLVIKSTNTVTRSVQAKNKADIAIGDVNLSNIQTSSTTIDTSNTVHGKVKAKGDGTTFKLGTVDIEGIKGGNLDISTDTTIHGDVSVKSGQEVSIGTVEIGKPKDMKKNSVENAVPHGMQGVPSDVINSISTNQAGTGISFSWPDLVGNGKDDICDPSNVDLSCYDINGCSGPFESFFWIAKFGDPNSGDDNLACNKHDTCYQTCGNSRSKCDLQFYYDMNAKCSILTIVTPLIGIECLNMATTYLGAVRVFGNAGFRDTDYLLSGVPLIGNKPFRGDLDPCDSDNKVNGDERCCVENNNYTY